MQKCNKVRSMRKGTAGQSLCGKRSCRNTRRKMVPDAGKEGRKDPDPMGFMGQMKHVFLYPHWGERVTCFHVCCRQPQCESHITFMHSHSGALPRSVTGKLAGLTFKSSPQTLDHLFKFESYFYYHICVCYAQEKTHFSRTLWRETTWLYPSHTEA